MSETPRQPPDEADPQLDSVRLPESVTEVELDGRRLYLVGTAHVSKQSIEDVRITIEMVRPDTVCVELDESRYRNLIDKNRWKKTNITRVIREGKAMLLLSSLIMTSFQRRIGKQLGVEPGAELLEGVRVAKETGARLVLADRDIQITLKRTWRNLGFFNRVKMATQLATSLFVAEEIDEKMIEELKQGEKLADALDMLAREFPLVKGPLIDERDDYLAEKVRSAPGESVVAVVGAGHVPGMVSRLEEGPIDVKPLDQVPGQALTGRVLKWAIPGVIIALLVYGFLTGEREQTLESAAIWFLINGSLSALGAAIALGHPITVLTAFVAAPLTSLNPMLAAGWVSGLVQAVVKKPTVEDLEQLPEAINTASGFWSNSVCRILLVVVFSNLGSVAGTFIAGSWIAVRDSGELARAQARQLPAGEAHRGVAPTLTRDSRRWAVIRMDFLDGSVIDSCDSLATSSHLHVRSDVNGPFDRPIDGTKLRVCLVDSLHSFAVRFLGLKPVADVDPLQDQHLAVFFDFSHRLGLKLAAARIDSTGLQRTAEGSGQSAGCRRHDVVDCRGMRLERRLEFDAVVLGDLTVDAEGDGFLLSRKARVADRAKLTADLNTGSIDHFTHSSSSSAS